MLEFLGFGRAKHEPVEAGDTVPVARPLPSDYPTPTQREMLRLTLHTLLKRHGIPAAWLGAEMGAFPMHHVAPRLLGTPGAIRTPAPRLGEHNRALLAAIGVDDAAYAQLLASGAVCEPGNPAPVSGEQ